MVTGVFMNIGSCDALLPIPHQTISRINADHRKVSNIRRTLVGNNIVVHSDVVGASPVGAAPTTSSFST